MSIEALLEQLNPQQRQAVLHTTGPAIVLAGAGSGKTKVLTTRAALLLDQKKARPDQILLVTFTNKAAGEIRNRVVTMTGFQLPYAGTFHSLCAKILRQDGYVLGLDPHFVIYDSDDQISLLKKIYKKHHLSIKDIHPKAVKNTISEAKNELLTPADYEQQAYGYYQEQSAKIYGFYQQELAAAQAVDFDDLLMTTVQLLQQHQVVREKYQQLFTYLLIDEYQDTNKAQYELSRLLAAPQNNLFVVGDFAQSIYAWRGADYKNMLQLTQDFPHIKEYRLEQNYRSTQTILDAASKIIANNTEHPVLSLWTEQTHSEKLHLIEAENNYEEARLVVDEIISSTNDYSYEEIAILYRTNAQSRAFEEAILTAGLPYQIVGGFKFYERKEIKDILAYVRVLTNPLDTISLQRTEKLGKRRLQALKEYQDKHGAEIASKMNQPAALLALVLDITEYAKKFDAKDQEDLSRIENIEELINVAAQFTSTSLFLENVALVQDDYMADANKDTTKRGVTLMSLHAAKGLEFSVIFMAGMEEGLLPHSRSHLDPKQMEEERRLCYVGITRAKHQLYFSFARQRYQYGSLTSSLQSRFISEIPSELFDTQPSYIQNNGHSFLSTPKTTPPGRRYINLDDTALDDVLSGDMDIETFLNS